MKENVTVASNNSINLKKKVKNSDENHFILNR